MVTKVGTQAAFLDALKDLLELEYDALAAYEVAIEKIQSVQCKEKMTSQKIFDREIQTLDDNKKGNRYIFYILKNLSMQYNIFPKNQRLYTDNIEDEIIKISRKIKTI